MFAPFFLSHPVHCILSDVVPTFPIFSHTIPTCPSFHICKRCIAVLHCSAITRSQSIAQHAQNVPSGTSKKLKVTMHFSDMFIMAWRESCRSRKHQFRGKCFQTYNVVLRVLERIHHKLCCTRSHEGNVYSVPKMVFHKDPPMALANTELVKKKAPGVVADPRHHIIIAEYLLLIQHHTQYCQHGCNKISSYCNQFLSVLAPAKKMSVTVPSN